MNSGLITPSFGPFFTLDFLTFFPHLCTRWQEHHPLENTVNIKGIQKYNSYDNYRFIYMTLIHENHVFELRVETKFEVCVILENFNVTYVVMRKA